MCFFFLSLSLSPFSAHLKDRDFKSRKTQLYMQNALYYEGREVLKKKKKKKRNKVHYWA